MDQLIIIFYNLQYFSRLVQFECGEVIEYLMERKKYVWIGIVGLNYI